MQSTTDLVNAEIRARLAYLGLEYKDLAEALGISAAGVSRRLSGAVKWDLDELAAVASLVGSSVSELTKPRNAA